MKKTNRKVLVLAYDLVNEGRELGPRSRARLKKARELYGENAIYIFVAGYATDKQSFPQQSKRMCDMMAAECGGLQCIVPEEDLWGHEKEIEFALSQLKPEDKFIVVTDDYKTFRTRVIVFRQLLPYIFKWKDFRFVGCPTCSEEREMRAERIATVFAFFPYWIQFPILKFMGRRT